MVFLSNTDDHDKPADPYKTANLDKCVSIKDKVKDLSDFVDSCKFGIMTTRDSFSGALVSRCMVVAAKVFSQNPKALFSSTHRYRRLMALT